MNYANFPLDKRMPLPNTEAEKGDDFIDVERLLGMAARQVKVVAVCAVIGLFLGVVYLQTTPKQFTSLSSVLIDEGLNKVVDDISAASATVQTDATILSQLEILSSARLASVVVDKLKLDQNDEFMNPPQSALAKGIGFLRGVVAYFRGGSGTDDIPGIQNVDAATREAMITAARHDYAVLKLQTELMADRVGRSNVITLGYQSTNPALATSITKAYAEAYLADQLNASFDATERAAVWLQGRLTELRQSSQQAAMEVEKFRAEHGLSANSDGQLMSGKQLSDLNAQLIIAQADTARASARYQQYKAIVDSGSENAFNDSAIAADQPSSSVIIGLKTRYLAVSKRLQDVEANFGKDHPQAVALAKEKADVAAQIFGQLKQITESYRNDFQVAQARETELKQKIAAAAGRSSIDNESQVRLRELDQQAQALSTLYQTFLSRYQEASQQQTFPVGKVRIISDANMPLAASSPRTLRVLALSLVLGLMLGVGFGGLNEFNERFFRTGEDIRDRVGLKFLGYLPMIGGGKPKDAKSDDSPADAKVASLSAVEKRARMRVSIDAPASMFAETLRNAKIAFDVVMEGQGSRVIGVISVLPGEGKSTVAANLAGLLAANGARTLLIDGDLRNPGLSRSLGMEAEHGLMEAVVSGQTWQSVGKVDRQTKLAIIPAVLRGQFSHTSELLSSAGMRRFLDNAKETFEYIVVDLPPLGPVVDAKAFAPFVDGFVLVAEWGRTPRAMVRSMLESETYLADKIVGAVLNKVDLKKLAKYGSFGGSEKFFDRYSSYYLEKPETRAKQAA
ncbi:MULTISPECIES: polysaccharide biosynthesis tyrosine autokinase [unclassified Mesorhizobium]|uniref:polysaccharide biosynthesis tyrosine autokinase n=1 Tax=unclassified Mesorhizobium TaxID=325217 RepID=UPI000BB076C0|nr:MULTISPECIES: polysaccharide biosynthesis tyrosine autokinase [unclassified Mesorhizobium]TGT60853.1 polysaccharide biosynthesis tyrosine autokinase [Mesorhizobium sp. M00.F.Ca.ET.170.01.1.1]AZO10045.1 polysaccharide biosynthesis tyrosine autokinase [Mesorhizobium sp. M3A.F.Ca.ET.080.04.2.1]PBB86504.1 chain-length determining protein [Mesorhizobium sp. WSM3876]RWB75731.1 MAG: polysaccharide biosynthesis tyrosine autokinase [Mesorhizobium sp.]RWB91483.1 MAG: polysaccharide biosynthesis tyros